MTAATPSNPARQAQKDIKFLVSLARGLTAFSDEIEEAGSLDALMAEKRRKLDALRSEEAGLQDKVTACDAECTQKRQSADQTLTDAIARADALKEAAEQQREDARRRLVEANREAAEIIAKAKLEAQRVFDAEIDAMTNAFKGRFIPQRSTQ